ncbi:hypothetical protein LTR37_005821 [Vermiconidia calcicola]|uniref:Uncharacterized protein n=1 Tax=Vermiconidia calcicola TaxID=1690605 RepID=A0ACC3NI34_9PEZI|nr:hypothetical protein LTR37_005821 [Vermiconidia calcicola]
MAPHPLQQVCHQIRSEFSSFLIKHRGSSIPRVLYVVDYKFHFTLVHLERYPSLHTQSRIMFISDLTTPGAEDMLQLREFGNAFQPTVLNSRNFSNANYAVNGTQYRISFVPPMASLHHRKDDWHKKVHLLALRAHQHGYPAVYHTLMHMFVGMVYWSPADTSVSEHRKEPRLKYFAPTRPKRHAEEVERQSKRRKLVEEGEWEIEEGFDIYGDADEQYEKLLEAWHRIKL